MCQASFRLLQKFANPKITKNRQFSEFFTQQLVPDLLDSHLLLISQARDNFVSKKALFFSINFVNNVLKNPFTTSIIIQNIETLLYDFMLPLFMMDVVEFSNYESEHQEYLTEALEMEMAGSKNIKMAAANLLTNILQFKSRPDSRDPPDYLEKFLGFLNDELQKSKNNDDW